MQHHLLPLTLVALLAAAPPSLAQDSDTSGVKLYKNAVSAAKLNVQPEKADSQVFDEKEALKISQGAIGKQLGDYTFLNRSGRTVRLSDYRGKPLVIDMIYTHCPFVCAIKTRNLDALKLSRDALGVDSFGVLTIGFDTENDTPEAMDDFGKRMDVKMANWEFVSADADTIKKLSKDLGFVFSPSPGGGFDHITQTTFVDGQGRVYQQIYGEEFDNKTLLEPLKNMIYNIKTAESGFAGLSNKVRLFCTVYDARTGKYNIDYSYFYGIGMGILVSLFITWWIVVEYRRSPKRSNPHHVRYRPR
jgi:protein SCO1/2